MKEDTISQFLGALFADKPDGEYISLGIQRDRLIAPLPVGPDSNVKVDDIVDSRFTLEWADSPQQALQAIANRAQQNCYVCISTIPCEPARGRIGQRADSDHPARYLYAFMVDCDLSHPKSLKQIVEMRIAGKPVPPHVEVARPEPTPVIDIFERHGLKPSVVNFTGHGLQLVWLLDRPLHLFTGNNRKIAMDTYIALRDRAAVLLAGQYEVDHCKDLVRMLRVPGTTNYKQQTVREDGEVVVHDVETEMLLFEPDRRFSLGYIASLLDKMPNAVSVSTHNNICERGPEFPYTDSICGIANADDVIQHTDGLVLNPSPNINLAWFTELMRDRRFKSLWNHDPAAKTEGADASDSGYDYSMAIHLIKKGVELQAVLDILVSHRRERGTFGSKDEQYFIRTVNNAAEAVTPRDEGDLYQAIERLRSLVSIHSVEFPEEIKTYVFNDVNRILGLEITAVELYIGDENLLKIVLADGNSIRFDSTYQFGNVRNAEMRHLNCVHKFFEPVVKKNWTTIASAILMAAQQITFDGLSTDAEVVADLIRDFIETRKISERAEDARKGRPIYDDEGRVLINMRQFLQWALQSRNYTNTPSRLAVSLRSLGLEQLKNCKRAGGTGIRFWVLPSHLLAPHDQE